MKRIIFKDSINFGNIFAVHKKLTSTYSLSNLVKIFKPLFLALVLLTGIGSNILFAQPQIESSKTQSYSQSQTSNHPALIYLQVFEDNNENDETSHWENESFTQTPNYQLSNPFQINNFAVDHKKKTARCIWRIFRNLRL